jgi:Rod binding domain-containing protein
VTAGLPSGNTAPGVGTVPQGNASRPAVPSRNPDTRDQKLRKAATEFESILISTIWKSMMESYGLDEESSDPGHSTFDDMGVQAISQALSKSGGFGIGSLIVKHLERSLEGTRARELAARG